MEQIKLSGNTLFISGNLTFRTVADVYEQVMDALKHERPAIVDLSGIDVIDSAGVAMLEALQDELKLSESSLLVRGASEEVIAVLKTFSSKDIQPESPPVGKGYFEHVGEDFLSGWQEFTLSLVMAADVFYWAIFGLFRRHGQKKGSTMLQCFILGFQALPVVVFLSLIFGFIISLQSAVQLKNFGANIYIADLISASMVREMGPMITAIIVAGRSGSAIASEIASMQVSEEIDALRIMAINPIRYVVVPKFHAMTIVMPLLVAFSILVGILGGLPIALGYLDLSLQTFYNRCVEILSMKDIIVSFSKSIFFAWVIVIIGSHFGFTVKGGAEGVGRATTNSVVASIFAVIFFDALFSLIYL